MKNWAICFRNCLVKDNGQYVESTASQGGGAKAGKGAKAFDGGGLVYIGDQGDGSEYGHPSKRVGLEG